MENSTEENKNENVTLILTIRLIRSFKYHNIQNLVIKNVKPDIHVNDFKQMIDSGNDQ
jgi:hypothetical protein